MKNVYLKENSVTNAFRLILFLLLLTGYQLTVFADTDLNTDPGSPKEKSAWAGSVQFGYSGTGGNSQDNKLTGKLDLLYNKNKWHNIYKLEALFSNSESGTTAERYAGTVEFNYNFKPYSFGFYRNNSIYDQFNSYDITIINAIGYGHRIYTGSKTTIDIQGGPGYRFARVAGTLEQERGAIAYLGSTLKWQISKNAHFQEDLNFAAGEENIMSKSESALTTDIIGNLGLQLSFTITNNSNTPADSTQTRNTDYRTDITLLFSF